MDKTPPTSPRSPDEWAEWSASDPTLPRIPAASGARALPLAAGSSHPRPTTTASLAERLRPHRAPLAAVAAVLLVAQLIFFATHPITPNAPDSTEYLARAASIASHGPLTDPRRLPGYPLLLALIFLLAGGRHLSAVIATQTLLTVATVFEIYVLGWRISRGRWLAAGVAALVAANVYMLDWQFSIRDETFSTWLLVTLLLLFERMVAGPGGVGRGGRRWRQPAGFGLVAVALILTRPYFVFLPALLLIGLYALALWGREGWRARAATLGLTLLAVYACVTGYMALNAAQSGYFGLSYVGGVNLFGKVIEYHMDALPVSAARQPLQRDLLAFERAGGGLYPWDFAARYGYTGDYYAPLSGYANEVIAHHPAQYALDTLRDLPAAWLDKPVLYAQGRTTTAFTLLRLIGRFALLGYALLPLLALWLAYRLWRDPADPAVRMQALLTLAVLGAIVMSATASYGEFFRLRAPVDWAYLLALALAGWDVARMALRLRPPVDGGRAS